MKSRTPFQEALLSSAEDRFADIPEEDQIQMTPSQEFYHSIPGKRKPLSFVRKAILIAAALALFVGVAFAAHYFTLGNTEVEIYQFPLSAEEIANGATAGSYVVELKFQEDFSNAAAPNSIETFYIPTLEILETADYSNYEIANNDYRYFPSFSKEEIEEWNRYYENLTESKENEIHFYKLFTDRIPENPTYAHGDWFVGENQIMFSQNLAKRIPEIDLFSIQYPGEWNPVAITERLIIGNYEVLSVFVEYEYPDEEEATKHSAYHWFWTNGEYFFSVMAEDVDQTFMQELMESVQPIEDIETYFDQE